MQFRPSRRGALAFAADGPSLRPMTLAASLKPCGPITDRKAAERLRALKKDVHLLTALSDLGGVWSLEQVTGALSAFADAAVQAALGAAVREEVARGRLAEPADASHGPVPGLFVLAMGKHGAAE